MGNKRDSIAVIGNVTLDIICKTVDEVHRHDSLSFQESAVTPGGCGSNTAIGLASMGETVFLIACVGNDMAAEMLRKTWIKAGIDISFVRECPGFSTGVSVGLVDSNLQPRFIHTPGANGCLKAAALDPDKLLESQVGYLHTAGYFVLPGLLEPDFADSLQEVRKVGIFTTLDVVTSPAMYHPDSLWPLLPALDIFLCNLPEAGVLTGSLDPGSAADLLHARGSRTVVIKLGAGGCWLSEDGKGRTIPPGKTRQVVDTTGAGDAFAAGLLAGLRDGMDLDSACRQANQQGAAAVGYLGAVQIG
jgi:ribokinase